MLYKIIVYTKLHEGSGLATICENDLSLAIVTFTPKHLTSTISPNSLSYVGTKENILTCYL